MKIDYLKIEKYKNLVDFEIDFSETSLITVIIGKNGTGKSNLIESIVLIFSHLYMASIYKNKPPFNYNLRYICNNDSNVVEIEANNNRKTGVYNITVDNIKISLAELISQDDSGIYKYLPKYIVAYYSGMSQRLASHFIKHREDFLDKLLKDEQLPLRPMLNARLVHSHFVLLSFFLYPNPKALKIIKEFLGIIGIESVQFVLKKPDWNLSNKKIKDGDKRFWYARGIVQGFLSKVYESSFAPITIKNNRSEVPEKIHIFIPEIEILKGIINKQKNYQKNTEFFKALESMDSSELIDEVKTVVKKIDIDGNVSYKELSEGEQQLLMVLGLMKFTKDKESLYLLDEPDTHLNPVWKYNYLQTLRDIIDEDVKSSQIIINTHDPLVFFGLDREEVIVFEKEVVKKITKIKTSHPEKHPNKMSINAILTSELFGLNSTLSPQTTEEMRKRRDLYIKKNIQKKKLTKVEEQELQEYNEELKGLINESITDDEIYNQFMVAMNEINKKDFSADNLTKSEIIERKSKAIDLLKSLIKKSK